MKIGRELPIFSAVMERDGHRCVACGFDLSYALAIHHVVPVGQGGLDTKSNLRTLCANCHRIVHWLSAAGRLEGKPGAAARRAVGAATFSKIRRLASAIRDHREHTQGSGNRWTARAGKSRGLMALDDALGLVARRNKIEPDIAEMMGQVVRRVIDYIPEDVRGECAYRLVRDQKFFSINGGNHLILRTPWFPDGENTLQNDLNLIWPQDAPPSFISAKDWSKNGDEGPHFSAIPCFNLDMSFDEALAMTANDWQVFGQACRDALRVRRTRNWISNVAAA
jgi:hypothetical protein